MDQKVIDLYDEYTHAPLDRRVFLSRLTGMVGIAAVPAVLAALEPNYAMAAMVEPNDKALETAASRFPAPRGAARPDRGRSPLLTIVAE